ncbi:MAG TPA: hypothetical protein PK604_14810 [Acetivibrio clariflavus]|nr:hypothetical protein [Acetivibrio clariflavus]HPU42254.1 hypothetical protein [Acetivibrio clariflavus]
MISHNSSAVAAFNNTYKYNNISQLLILCATFAYASSFCIDWQTRFAFSVTIRSGKNSYALSKCVAASVAGGTAVAIGAALFISYICVTQPSILPKAIEIENEFSYQAFGDLLMQGKPSLFFLSYIYIIFLQASFFSSLGLTLSAYIPNRYVAYISPFCLCFMFNQVSNVFEIPIWLDPMRLAAAKVYYASTSAIIGITTATFISLTAICNLLFICTVKRRIANG